MGLIDFSVQAQSTSRADWLSLARRAEQDGYVRLYGADHPGLSVSPVPALASAAAVTSDLAVGALVMNTGVHEPFDIAADVASLQLLSGGRAVLGLGAGHTPAEWAHIGRDYPSADARISRLFEVADVVRELLSGAAVDFAGEHITVQGRLEIADGQPRVPLLIGGNGRRLLRYAARHADIIGMTGLGRTLADGHSHQVQWTPAQIDERVELITDATPAGRQPIREALVQTVRLTDDAEAVAAQLISEFGAETLTPQQVLDSPYALIGTPEEIVTNLRRQAKDRGITAFVVRADTLDQMRPIREAMVRNHDA
ncbi:TIGR03621 family F420-dependent LLM class oxidoreductase [Saxibacter everestensis]|uniref:TIGR03621 family F420-dependent LLM class oxidoreductase n=1 Tax=Saxibacter everestensis TaxID=2909229 RepID=A0ABY8QPQ1_9MICO|nr:TIGR03621 family F420-dependent LLM class oxidoreductase [Brevibacteriaceae bacterium ZFBP1038]